MTIEKHTYLLKELLQSQTLEQAIKKVIFKNCAPFTDFISEINNANIDNAISADVVMPMYNLIEYSDDYLKTSVSLWQYLEERNQL